MTDNLPDDWQIPTFRAIADPPAYFGMTSEQFSMSIMFGGMPSLIIINIVKKNLLVDAIAIGLAAILILSLMFVFRHLYKIDRYWFEGLTSHRIPSVRYLGK